MNTNWNGLMKVLEIRHETKDGKLLWKEENLYNLLHTEGEEFILRALFLGQPIPANYYLGLDNRITLDVGDDQSTAITNGEPTVNGYVRQSVVSDIFTISINSNGFNQANSPIVSFQASGGSWGPVRNIFLTNVADASGFLIASAPLTSTIIVSDSEIVSMRLGMALKDCPT
jgi:hypothetical protein